MQRQRIILISGVILAVIAVFMVKVFLDQQRQLAIDEAKKKLETSQANQTAVLVAKKDIPKGSTIEPDFLEVQTTPNQYVQPQAVTSLDRISGMITITAISKGEQLTLSKLTYPKQRGGLAEATPVGKRAITISVDNIASLAGMIKPGDYVDVIAMVPTPVQTPEGKQQIQLSILPLFQNVLVLAVGQETGVSIQAEARYKKEQRQETTPLITLALNPQEANIIVFVQEQAKIRLILRSPADSNIQPVQLTNWDTIQQYMFPKEASKEIPQREEPQVEYVEIYRGLSKEKMPLSK